MKKVKWLSIFLVLALVCCFVPMKTTKAADLYTGFTADSAYDPQHKVNARILSLEDKVNNQTRVVYCFNKTINTPNTAPEGTGYELMYEDASGQQFINSMAYKTGGRPTRPFGNDPETLKKVLLHVIKSGYPYNDSGVDLRQKAIDLYGVPESQADEFLRLATQHAVWYYTDDFDDPKTFAELIQLPPGIEKAADINMMAYEIITLAEANKDNPPGMTLDIFVQTGFKNNGVGNKQNLLAVDKTYGMTPVIPTQPVYHRINVSKINIAGEEIGNAHINISGANNQGLAITPISWISQKDVSEVINLEAGNYVFHEEAAPTGYKTVTDINFSVDDNGEVTITNLNGNEADATADTLTVTDQYEEHQINISKVNLGGEEIAGAEIEITGTSIDGTTIAPITWTSVAGQSETISLLPGSYTFHEEAAPTGYKEVTDITFEVDLEGKVTVVDANGNTADGAGSTLTVTDQYKVHQINISKVNLGGEEIAGAEIEITGTSIDGTIIAPITWTSVAGQSETISLLPGSYTFHEEAAPTGYKAVTDITFEVDLEGKVTVVDANGNTVDGSGSTLTVTDQYDDTNNAGAGTGNNNPTTAPTTNPSTKPVTPTTTASKPVNSTAPATVTNQNNDNKVVVDTTEAKSETAKVEDAKSETTDGTVETGNKNYTVLFIALAAISAIGIVVAVKRCKN